MTNLFQIWLSFSFSMTKFGQIGVYTPEQDEI